jgi:hypothetical protein
MRAQGPAHCLLAFALAFAPVVARSAPPPTADPDDDVGAMWREANAKLATSDYTGAIELLTRIYEEVARDPEARMLRLRVRWALHEAHLGAERLDHDAQHLYVAREVLKNGMSDFGPDDAEMRTKSEAAIAELDARIAKIEAERAAVDAQRREADERAAEEERRRKTAAATEPPPPRPVATEPPKPQRGLLVGGGVAAGIGVAGLAILAAGFGTASRAVHTFEVEPDARDEARRAIHRSNAIGIAGAVIAGVGITVAAILLPLAVRRAKPTNRAALHLPRWNVVTRACAHRSHPCVTAM